MRTRSASRTITRDPEWLGPAIPPGEMLLEEFLEPLGLGQVEAARRLGISLNRLNEIVLGKRAITPSMSIRFGAFFGQSDTFWHCIQVECDFRALTRKRKQLVSGIQPATSLVS